MLTPKLLSGIPRSGTTLCCNILNQQEGVVALHEPINPATIQASNHCSLHLAEQIKRLQQSIFDGAPFEHGDKGGLGISNPVSVNRSEANGKRLTTANRGLIRLPEFKGTDCLLVVKQNALFAANLTGLTNHYDLTCIVRNPVDVMMSWWSINLPVSKGRLPAAEKFDVKLAKELSQHGVYWRQFRIYEWFCRQFKQSQATVIKYEDILKTGGQCLFDALTLPEAKPVELNKPKRQFRKEELVTLQTQSNAIRQLNTQGYYCLDEINERLHQLLEHSE